MKLFALLAASALTLAACDVPTTYSGGGNDGRNRVVDIVNDTGVTMTRFYASNTNQRDWGHDRFGSTVLYSGNYKTLNIDDGTGACMFDLRAQFADGDVVTRSNFNVCVESSWRVY
ncbi:MAG: hypothetical protein JKY31_08955 [Rhodobacteraceae bacterium]|nr:hypothetical protein [Paracoccaceae bacterium]